MVDDHLKDHPARVAAKAMNLSRFSTGAPCHVGHHGPRYTSNVMCCECSVIAGRKRRAMANATEWKTSPEAKAARIEAARELRKRLKIEDVRLLPKPALAALAGYTESAIGRRNSEHLNALIRNIHAPTPKVEPVAVDDWRKRKSGTRENRFRIISRTKWE